MTLRIAQRLHAIAQVLRVLAGGLLLAGGVIALCWVADLVTIR